MLVFSGFTDWMQGFYEISDDVTWYRVHYIDVVIWIIKLMNWFLISVVAIHSLFYTTPLLSFLFTT